jgi:hypothetical protein
MLMDRCDDLYCSLFVPINTTNLSQVEWLVRPRGLLNCTASTPYAAALNGTLSADGKKPSSQSRAEAAPPRTYKK